MLDFKANGEAGMLFPVNGEADSTDTTYRLGRLEVYNWGPFNGLHRADFDSIGTAIIGPTGSGKTTLVDALMTLLVAHPRYNLASTGGHESDRTLPSYVRGELGGDGSTKREDVLLPGKTVTGVCATYEARGEYLRLAALFWFDGTSTAATDLKRRWIFSQAEAPWEHIDMNSEHDDLDRIPSVDATRWEAPEPHDIDGLDEGRCSWRDRLQDHDGWEAGREQARPRHGFER